jgi:hypothetical protein
MIVLQLFSQKNLKKNYLKVLMNFLRLKKKNLKKINLNFKK